MKPTEGIALTPDEVALAYQGLMNHRDDLANYRGWLRKNGQTLPGCDAALAEVVVEEAQYALLILRLWDTCHFGFSS